MTYFVINKAYFIWGWQEFKKQYGNLDKLQIYFSRIPIMAVLITITQNVLEYIRVILHLHMLVHFYKRILDQLNITYIVQQIKRKKFQELDILLLNDETMAMASV